MKKLLLAAAMLVAMTGSSLARTVEQQLISSLQKQGYVVLEQGYTFLGRLRIVAQNDEFRREIVVNPGTGEILRDYAVSVVNRTAPEADGTASASRPAVATTSAPAAPGAGDASAAPVDATRPTIATTATVSTPTTSTAGADDGVAVTSGMDDTAEPGPDLSTSGDVPQLVLPESVLPLAPGEP